MQSGQYQVTQGEQYHRSNPDQYQVDIDTQTVYWSRHYFGRLRTRAVIENNLSCYLVLREAAKNRSFFKWPGH